MYQLNFLQWHRRSLHLQNSVKMKKGVPKHFRRRNGGTISNGIVRGSVVRDIKNNSLCYVGGWKEPEKVSIHKIETGKRISKIKKILELKTLYISKFRIQYLETNSSKNT